MLRPLCLRPCARSPRHALNLYRSFSASRSKYQDENPQFSIQSSPWKLSTDPPRIENYPYQKTSQVSIINWLPVTIQRALSQWAAWRTLQLNTGTNYFPDEFLLGSTMATRRAVQVLTDHLNRPATTITENEEKHDNDNDNDSDELSVMFTPEFIQDYLGPFKKSLGDDRVSIQLPQIYDATVHEVWVTLGSKQHLSSPRQFELFEWMTLCMAVKKSNVPPEDESFVDFRQRASKAVMEGVQIKVDVSIDADVIYKKTGKKDEGEEVQVYDEARRPLLVRFETPYFATSPDIITGRDPKTGEPINDWNWRISDIDHTLERAKLELEHRL